MTGTNLAELLPTRARGLLVQGITGTQGRIETDWMQRSGTPISAGVTPGRAGDTVHGIPVYGTVAEAVERHGCRSSMIYAPGERAVAAAEEAIHAGIKLVLVAAEGLRLHQVAGLAELARDHRSVLLGPNCQGLVIPDSLRIGSPGGPQPWDRFARGDVGIVSRSGGMASEIATLVRIWGHGTSAHLHVGGSPFVWTRMVSAADLVASHPATRRMIVIGEPSGDQEIELAESYRERGSTLPVIALILGRTTDGFEATTPFGHAPRAGASGVRTTAAKVEALEQAGIRVARSLTELRRLLDTTAG